MLLKTIKSGRKGPQNALFDAFNEKDYTTLQSP